MDQDGNESKPYLRPRFKAPFPPKEDSAVPSTSATIDKDKPAETPAAMSRWWGGVIFIQRPAERVSAWEASRLMADGGTVPAGSFRPLTWRNVLLAARLAPHTFLELGRLSWNAAGFSLIIMFLSPIIFGILPAWTAVTTSALLDCAQQAMTPSTPVDTTPVVRKAFWALVASHSGTLLSSLLSSRRRKALRNIEESIELSTSTQCMVSKLMSDSYVNHNRYIYLKSHLVLDIPTLSNPKIAPLLMEAGVFAGFEMGRAGRGRYVGSPSMWLDSTTNLMTTVVSVVSNATVMFTTVLRTTSGSITLSSLIFVLMSFIPSLLGLFATTPRQAPPPPDSIITKGEIRQMGGNGQYKQEILLFGLADWVMDKWQEFREYRRSQQDADLQSNVDHGISFARRSVGILGHTLIAIRLLPASGTMGSLNLCQSCAESLIGSIQSLKHQTIGLMRLVFHGTAFLESQRLAETLLRPKGEVIDYVSMIHPNGRRGMKIEARNLSFTYPGQPLPALKGVNIVIEPGETLAIVGFNGGGKTTLVKVSVLFMPFARSVTLTRSLGPYDYKGTLLINDRPASSYTRSSLHAHTTVCFQDYAKYNLSVKENVGTGNYPRIGDAALMAEALKKGGADGIVSKFPKGVEERLSKVWIPAGGKETGLLPRPQAQGVPPQPPPPPPAKPQPPSGASNLPPETSPTPAKAVTSSPPQASNGAVQEPKVLGRLGQGLSGGQWQRIALARAFMRSEEADLVVFDEPSASLDARAEHELFERIHSLSLSESGEKIRTTIYVSHRFNTTRRADKIAVIDDGTVAEFGSHDELMKLNGRYAELFNLQAKAFVD
ncbi:hypothetical protein FRB99_000904 [Tulasnella sp. 403]|nr:hypothetical protein FRB99_000904 [Tulasnella sp. 403]